MHKIATAVAILAWAGFAAAGEYHVYDKLKCSQCHTMHASRAHGLNGTTVESNFVASNGNPTLLMQDSVNKTCLGCHNGTGGPDVYGSATSAGKRSAGALNGNIAGQTLGNASDVAGTAYADWMGHTMGSLNTPPGWNGATGVWGTTEFECSDCHAVHGSTSYRNLVNSHGRATIPAGTVVSYQVGGTFDATYDVNVLVEGEDTANIAFGKGGVADYKGVAGASSTNSMNTLCASCHGNFHGAGTTNGTELIKHPTTGVAIAASSLIGGATVAGSTASLVRPIWTDNAQANFEAGCLSCHKGHGNARGFGLIYPGVTETTVYGAKATAPATITDYEQGDAAATVRNGVASYPIRNLCITCHSQGRTKR